MPRPPTQPPPPPADAAIGESSGGEQQPPRKLTLYGRLKKAAKDLKHEVRCCEPYTCMALSHRHKGRAAKGSEALKGKRRLWPAQHGARSRAIASGTGLRKVY